MVFGIQNKDLNRAIKYYFISKVVFLASLALGIGTLFLGIAASELLQANAMSVTETVPTSLLVGVFIAALLYSLSIAYVSLGILKAFETNKFKEIFAISIERISTAAVLVVAGSLVKLSYDIIGITDILTSLDFLPALLLGIILGVVNVMIAFSIVDMLVKPKRRRR